jgi:hypothetical protein
MQMGYVAVSSIYPWEVEKWNSSKQVIFQIHILVLGVFDKDLKILKHIGQLYSSNDTLKSLNGVYILTKA